MSTLWIIPDENGASVFFYHKLKIYLDYVYWYLEGSSGLSFSLDGRCGLEFSLENSKFSLENLKELSFSSFLF